MSNNEKIINGYTNQLIIALNNEYKKNKKTIKNVMFNGMQLMQSMGFYEDRFNHCSNIEKLEWYDIENIDILEHAIEYLQDIANECRKARD